MKRDQIKKRPLSDTVIANLEPEAKEYNEVDSKGLYLFVKPTGAKSWKMRYKDAAGKWRWHGLGAYPHVTGAVARKLVLEKQQQLALGAEELTARQSLPNSKTFGAVVEMWFNEPNIKRLSPNTIIHYQNILNIYVLPRMRNKNIAKIDRQTWLQLFRDIQQRTNTQTGGKIIQSSLKACRLCSRIYRFALTESIAGVTSNPLDHLHERLEKEDNAPQAHLSESELPQMIRDIQAIPSEITRLGIMLCFHLFMRPGEIVCGRWAEVDFDNRVWEIPAHRMKKRRAFIVPLSDQVLAILRQLHSFTGHEEFIFPANAANHKNKICRFRSAFHKLGYSRKQTLHGFRHIASTKLNNHTDENGNKFDGRVIEFSLAHKVQGVAGVYNKAEYLHDRQIMYQWYSDWIDTLI